MKNELNFSRNRFKTNYTQFFMRKTCNSSGTVFETTPHAILLVEVAIFFTPDESHNNSNSYEHDDGKPNGKIVAGKYHPHRLLRSQRANRKLTEKLKRK